MQTVLACFMVGLAVHGGLFAVKTGEAIDRIIAATAAAGATLALIGLTS